MVMEVRISEDYCRSDIQIYDLSFISVGHVSKFTLPLLKKYEMCAIVSVAKNVLIKRFIHLNSCTQKRWIRIFPSRSWLRASSFIKLNKNQLDAHLF
jgi:hypothetical protein